MKATSWPCHQYVTSQTRISQIALYFSTPQLSGSGDGSHSLIFLLFADWSGKWHSPLLLQPIQFKVKWCVLSEMSFCTLLLYWAVMCLWPVNLHKFCHSPLTPLTSHWGADSESSEWHPVILVCLKDHIPSIVAVSFCCELFSKAETRWNNL